MASKNQKSTAAMIANLFKLIASPTRVRILQAIAQLKTPSVQDVARHLRMTHSAVSHQLAVLDAGEVVESTRVGRLQVYMISNTDRARTLMRSIANI